VVSYASKLRRQTHREEKAGKGALARVACQCSGWTKQVAELEMVKEENMEYFYV